MSQSTQELFGKSLRMAMDMLWSSPADALSGPISGLISDLTLVQDGILPSELMLAVLCICISFPLVLALVVKFEMGTYLPTIFGSIIFLNYCSYQITSFIYRTKRLLSLLPLYLITLEILIQIMSTFYIYPIENKAARTKKLTRPEHLK